MQQLILLHGALGAASQLNELKEKLSKNFEAFSFNFEGHGGQTIERPYTIEHFAENLNAFIQKNNIDKPHLFGYSMGGYVALYHAHKYPNQLKKIITLGTKFNWTKESAEREVKFLDAEKIEAKVPAFAKYLSSLHGEDNWKLVLKYTADMMIALGAAPSLSATHFTSIPNLCYIGLGDQDEMVTQEESSSVASSLPNANFYLLENTPHPIDKINVNLIADKIRHLLN